MASSSAPPNGHTQNAETEMPMHQLGLADSCFEEGQYDSAIAILEQLRSPSYKPNISHIRQLIYISLHSSAEPPDSDGDKSLFESPSKLAKQRPHFSIPPPTVLAARRLLLSYINTNSPESLGRALPFYATRDPNARVGFAPLEEAYDSIIAKQAMCIKSAKNVWGVLKEGFAEKTRQAFATPKGKGGRMRRDSVVDAGVSDEDSMIVGEDAWFFLEWLLTLFEHDEEISEEMGLPRHSSLLVQQIPPPRTGSDSRWDTSAPLDVVFFCFDQSSLRRRRMGYRLLMLLINLSSTTHLSLPIFTSSVFSRLGLNEGSSSSLTETYTTFLSNITPSPAANRFKLELCQKVMNEAILNGSAQQSQKGGRPKPMQRAQPLPRARALKAGATSDNVLDTPPSNAGAGISPQSQATKHPLPSGKEIIRLLTSSPSSSSFSTSLVFMIKFELLFSYGSLVHAATAQDDNGYKPVTEWVEMLKDQQMGVLKSAFSVQGDEVQRDKVQGEGELYFQMGKSLISSW